MTHYLEGFPLGVVLKLLKEDAAGLPLDKDAVAIVDDWRNKRLIKNQEEYITTLENQLQAEKEKLAMMKVHFPFLTSC